MNYKKGQILVITLLILTVLAITIIGVVIVINRDTFEVENTQLFEESFSSTELALTDLIQQTAIAPRETIADTLFNTLDAEYSCQILQQLANGNDLYICNRTVLTNELEAGNREVETTVEIEEQKTVENLKIKKDRTFTLDLANYSDQILLEWDQPGVAMEFMVTLRNTSTDKYYSIIDVYDGNQQKVFESFETLTPSTITQELMYSSNPVPSATSVEIDIGQTLNAIRGQTTKFDSDIQNANIINIRITPRSNSIEEIRLSVFPSNSLDFPTQVRNYKAYSEFEDVNSPQAVLSAEIFLYPQLDSIFNYSLLTQGNL